MEKDIKETIQRVIDAGERAVEELIKVAEEEIITGKPDDELAADRSLLYLMRLRYYNV
jgi:hypothetical protein